MRSRSQVIYGSYLSCSLQEPELWLLLHNIIYRNGYTVLCASHDFRFTRKRRYVLSRSKRYNAGIAYTLYVGTFRCTLSSFYTVVNVWGGTYCILYIICVRTFYIAFSKSGEPIIVVLQHNTINT